MKEGVRVIGYGPEGATVFADSTEASRETGVSLSAVYASMSDGRSVKGWSFDKWMGDGEQDTSSSKKKGRRKKQ